ncbi:hypothetical protein [Phenylobacterium sp.]|jgi:hypothetical protein|uniref:hypothetical protein n=1 Tax=Phenylobacterium sp. TaxID=1871053 RepID=UPI002F940E9A
MADDIWQAWRELVRTMSVRSLLLEFFFSRSVWSQWGVDYVSGLRLNRSSRRVFGLVGRLAPVDARRLHAIALINHRRLEAISRWTAVAAVTAPASAILMIAQVSPALLKRVHMDAKDWVLLAISGFGLLWVLMAAWRARQMVTVVELAFVEHGLSLQGGEAAEEEAPISAPMGA